MFFKDVRAAQMIKDIGYSEDEIILHDGAYERILPSSTSRVTDWRTAQRSDDYLGLAWGGTPTNPHSGS
jgi:hypothetical protein